MTDNVCSHGADARGALSDVRAALACEPCVESEQVAASAPPIGTPVPCPSPTHPLPDEAPQPLPATSASEAVEETKNEKEQPVAKEETESEKQSYVAKKEETESDEEPPVAKKKRGRKRKSVLTMRRDRKKRVVAKAAMQTSVAEVKVAHQAIIETSEVNAAGALAAQPSEVKVACAAHPTGSEDADKSVHSAKGEASADKAPCEEDDCGETGGECLVDQAELIAEQEEARFLSEVEKHARRLDAQLEWAAKCPACGDEEPRELAPSQGKLPAGSGGYLTCAAGHFWLPHSSAVYTACPAASPSRALRLGPTLSAKLDEKIVLEMIHMHTASAAKLEVLRKKHMRTTRAAAKLLKQQAADEKSKTKSKSKGKTSKRA